MAKYDRLKECLERVREHAIVNGVSHLALPRIGCVDERLEWINVAICIDSIFQDRPCTVTVYTPEDEMERYPEVEMTQRNEKVRRFSVPLLRRRKCLLLKV